jgi:hypothetical protein
MTSATVQSLLGDSYDYIWDNASKGATGGGKAIIDCAKEWNSKLLTYVSSAGIYKPNDIFPMPENTVSSFVELHLLLLVLSNAVGMQLLAAFSL